MVQILSMCFVLVGANAQKNIVVFLVASSSLIILGINSDITWVVGANLLIGSLLGVT